VNERYALQIIGPAVRTRNPMIHGRMNRYATHVSRSRKLENQSRALEGGPGFLELVAAAVATG